MCLLDTLSLSLSLSLSVPLYKSSSSPSLLLASSLKLTPSSCPFLLPLLLPISVLLTQFFTPALSGCFHSVTVSDTFKERESTCVCSGWSYLIRWEEQQRQEPCALASPPPGACVCGCGCRHLRGFVCFFHGNVVCLRGKCAVFDLSLKKKRSVKTKLASGVKAGPGKQVRG